MWPYAKASKIHVSVMIQWFYLYYIQAKYNSKQQETYAGLFTTALYNKKENEKEASNSFIFIIIQNCIWSFSCLTAGPAISNMSTYLSELKPVVTGQHDGSVGKDACIQA